MKKSLYLAMAATVSLLACKKKEETKPLPPNTVACFTSDKTLVDSGEVVTLTNCSTNADTYLWDLDEGGIKNEKNQQLAFKKRGSKVITLQSQNGVSTDTQHTTIVVGYRSISKIRINKYKTTTDGTTSWDPDDNSNPDIILVFGPASNPTKYSTPVQMNTAQGTVIDISPNIKLDETNNSNWVFKLVDDDGGNQQPMTTFGAGTDKLYPTRGTKPMKIVSSTDWDIDLEMDLVK